MSSNQHMSLDIAPRSYRSAKLFKDDDAATAADDDAAAALPGLVIRDPCD